MGRIITRHILAVAATLAAAVPVSAQARLPLSDAISRAMAQNPDAGSAAAIEREAAARVTQARGSYLPRVDVAQSWQRGNNPVFAFSSRLAQQHFTQADFALEALNRPAAANNIRTSISVEQSLFDRTAAAHVRAAAIARHMAATGSRLVAHDLASTVTEAFGRVLIAAATVRSTAAAVETARADRELAGNRRDAGCVTDADVLQLDVYVALTREREVQAMADERIARARLNQLMGEPLSMVFDLDPAPAAGAIDIARQGALEDEAVTNRPEVALARQQEQLARAAADTARAAFLPHVSAQGGLELNAGAWQSRSSSWMAAAVVQVNVFRGFADRARLTEAREQVKRRAIETGKAETMARLDVQVAIARLEAARASEAVGRAAADRARESRRIVRDRYESGLTDAAMLLRAADAVQQAEAQQIAARVNVLTATAALLRATGRQ
ncbi:MAG TPA: TolC family protein [Vicinamibacterales bacterium]|nr:TolC family protein [Vicinamibacterales bacterium]